MPFSRKITQRIVRREDGLPDIVWTAEIDVVDGRRRVYLEKDGTSWDEIVEPKGGDANFWWTIKNSCANATGWTPARLRRFVDRIVLGEDVNTMHIDLGFDYEAYLPKTGNGKLLLGAGVLGVGIFAALLLMKAGKSDDGGAEGASPGTGSGEGRECPMIHVQDVSHIVKPEVLQGFQAFSDKFESTIDWMYQDVLGYVTVGVGNLIDQKTSPEPPPSALNLPWLRSDGSCASEAEVRAEWLRVKAMPKAKVASHYKSSEGLHLSAEGIASLVASHLAKDAIYIAKKLPDFADYPAPVQQALLSIAWAVGAGFVDSWPNFITAIKARDWAAAAENCTIKTAGNPGVAPRNVANAELLRSAVGAS